MKSLVIKTNPISISVQKMNLAAGLVRRKNLADSINLISFTPNKGARIIHKLLKGAQKQIENSQQQAADFVLSRIEVNRGRMQKKLIYRAKGRTDRIVKRYSLIKIFLDKSTD